MAFSVSGTAYTDKGVTTMGSGRTVKLSVNGAAASAGASGTTTTASDGTFSFTGVTASAAQPLTVYLQGNTELGAAVTMPNGAGTAVTAFDVWQNYLRVVKAGGAAVQPNGTQLNTSDNNGDSGITGIYSAPSNTSLTMATGKHLYVGASVTFYTVASYAMSSSGDVQFASSTSWQATGTLTFTATSGTQNLTTNGINLGNITVGGSGGTVLLNDALNLPASGSVTISISAGATLDVSASNYGITLAGGGSFTNSGTFTARSGTITCSGGSTTLDLGSSHGYGLSMTSGNVTVTTNALILDGALTINGAGKTFDANGLAVTVAGLTTLTAGTYLAKTATQTFNGGLTVSSGTFTGSSGGVAVNGTLTLSGGTLTAPSGTFTVSGNWARSGAPTFTPGTNTVTLNGTNQTISGSTTFYNLIKTVAAADTLTFTAGTTQTITNALTLLGVAGQLLSLRSSATGSVYTIGASATQTLGYLDVKDSTATTNIAAAGATSAASGHNTGWTFGGVYWDMNANSGYQTASSNYTFNRTVAGDNTFLTVDVAILSVPGTTVTSVTDDDGGGNVAMSLVGVQSVVAGTGRIEQWGLKAPIAGTKTIRVILSTAVASAADAVNYGGVDQTTQTESFNSTSAINTGIANQPTLTVTPATDNTWPHVAIATSATAITAGQTARNNVTGTLGSGANEDTGPISPAAGTALTYSGLGITDAWAIAGYAIRPVPAVGGFFGSPLMASLAGGGGF